MSIISLLESTERYPMLAPSGSSLRNSWKIVLRYARIILPPVPPSPIIRWFALTTGLLCSSFGMLRLISADDAPPDGDLHRVALESLDITDSRSIAPEVMSLAFID